ncbi:MBL fold metallo-hydrolase [Alkalihalobacillus sp. CinArs1]|uniref:MBL fold metallo-hydrolase n=1 Tax=Alkalihalobacillus sp. CinArs1 TaxID=2995314 RepID=UPI0022DD6ECE|nr:MBL fold metallo-hydrolase [Alkalihalobacillus sp. CinArs1]
MTQPEKIGEDLYLVDLNDLNLEKRTGSYILAEEEITIIETSASPSIPHLLNGLEELNIDLKKVRNIIVTHIHLDHAGGTGLFLEKCPNARVIVHQKGYRHLENPSRLIQGAKAVYGEKFDELFDPIIPIPSDRLLTMEDGEKLSIGEDRVLTFIDTPGHAKHHFSILDSKTNGVFVGDTIGVYYPLSDVELYLPSTSPNQFNPHDMLDSLEKIMAFNPDAIYFGHYGKSDAPEHVTEQLTYWLPEFIRSAETIVNDVNEGAPEYVSKLIADDLFTKVQTTLSNQGIATDHHIYRYIELDLSVCAMGLYDYIIKQQAKTP